MVGFTPEAIAAKPVRSQFPDGAGLWLLGLRLLSVSWFTHVPTEDSEVRPTPKLTDIHSNTLRAIVEGYRNFTFKFIGSDMKVTGSDQSAILVL